MKINKINIAEKLSFINKHWDPKIVGELNGQHIKLAKIKGEFTWHHHELEDEMFLVIEGEFNMELRDQTIALQKGDFLIIPKGVEHKPVAKHEASIMLFEPAGTLNTGNTENEFTKYNPEIL